MGGVEGGGGLWDVSGMSFYLIGVKKCSTKFSMRPRTSFNAQ